jgi:hypothetical protein
MYFSKLSAGEGGNNDDAEIKHYDEYLAPVVNDVTVRIKLVVIWCMASWCVHLMDVRGAFRTTTQKCPKVLRNSIKQTLCYCC